MFSIMLVTLTTMFIIAVMMFMVHPVSFIIFMLIYTSVVAIMMSLYLDCFWYGYILMLIFLGGMLILFLYIASIAPSEKFPKTPKSKVFTLIISFLIVNIVNNYYFQTSSNITSCKLMSSSIIKLYAQNMIITMFLVLYLLITLLIVVKIVNIYKGPLRSN